jgi:hypothetical protein
VAVGAAVPAVTAADAVVVATFADAFAAAGGDATGAAGGDATGAGGAGVALWARGAGSVTRALADVPVAAVTSPAAAGPGAADAVCPASLTVAAAVPVVRVAEVVTLAGPAFAVTDVDAPRAGAPLGASGVGSMTCTLAEAPPAETPADTRDVAPAADAPAVAFTFAVGTCGSARGGTVTVRPGASVRGGASAAPAPPGWERPAASPVCEDGGAVPRAVADA